MGYAVVFKPGERLAEAVAVEWTDLAAPVTRGTGWEPCLRLANGDWRLPGCETAAPGTFDTLALRYRLAADGAWSPVSDESKVLIAAPQDAWVPVAPLLLAVPVLAGTGKIGSEVAVRPGLWSGDPAPDLTLQWQCGGADIPGATGASYVPGPGDDGQDLACVVGAGNAAGRVLAVTASLRVSHVAPVARGALFEEIFDQGSGVQTVAAAGDFVGENLSFSAVGAGATIDAAGVVGIPTDLALAETVLVTAMNSGGAATSAFQVTVEAPEVALETPRALGTADFALVRSVWRPGGQGVWFSPVLRFPGLEGEVVDAIEWTTGGKGIDPEVVEAQFGIVTPLGNGEFALHMRDPARNDPLASPRVDDSVWQEGEARRDHLRFRWRRSPDAPWSPLSVAARVEKPDFTIRPETGELLWRPMIVRPKELFGPDQVDFPALYDRGRYGGEGHQYAHGIARGLSDPDRVIWGQDMGSVRISNDDGHTWAPLPNIGNPLIGGESVAIDPADADVMLALMSASHLGTVDAELNALEGVYRSTNAGVNWTLVQAIPEVPFQQRYHQENFACWPPRGGTATGRQWRLLSMYQADKGTELEGGSYWTSTDGGVTWKRGLPLPAPMGASKVFALVQHPGAADTLYACTSSGIWRTTDNGGLWSQPWEGSIPGESRALWIDPGEPDRIFASITSENGAARGLWYSANGGSDWSRVLDFDILNFAVGAPDPAGSRMIYVHAIRGKTIRVGKWTGSSRDGRWITPTVHPLQQDPAVRVKPAFQNITGVQQAAFSPHPTLPLSCLCHGRAVWWRSDDGGLNWFDSSTGFGGQSARKAHFDPSDWRRIDFACADIGALFTPNAGDWCVESNCSGPSNRASSQWGRMRAEVGAGNVAYRSATDITRLPDTAAVTDPAARGRRIMALGGNVRQFIFTQDKGQSTWNDRIEQPVGVGGSGTARWFVDHSRQDPNVVYCGQNVSTDGGTTWGETQGSARICAMSHQDGDVVYAQNGLQSFLRSTDRGASWEGFFSAGYRLAFNATQPAFWLSPHDHRRAFTWSSTRDVLMLYGDPGSVRSTPLALLRQYDAPPPGFQIKCVGFSGTDPRLIFVLVDVTGAPCIFRGDFDAGFAAISWTDISRNCSRLAQSSDLAVHPQTGDVFVMTGHGIWVFPPPGGPGASSVWANCPRPIPNGWR